MKKSKAMLRAFLYSALLLQPISSLAWDSIEEKSEEEMPEKEMQEEEKPEFVLAVFATNRTRASLLIETQNLNIFSYNMNWQSKVEDDCVRKVWIRAEDRWVLREQAPLPDVVYDFGVYKNAKKRKIIANALKAELGLRNIPFINPEDAMAAVNDKIIFAKVMHQYGIPHPKLINYKERSLKDRLSKYDLLMPRFDILEYQKCNLEEMLRKHDILFLKPKLGSKGQGIIIIEKIDHSKPSLFTLKYKIKSRGEWHAASRDDIRRKKVYDTVEDIRKELNKMRNTYLIQQGIKTFTYDGKQTDFRVNVQRGKGGELICSGMAMRVGGNLSQGGRPADYNDVLSASGLPIEAIAKEVVEVAINTHRALEEFSKRKIGDLGIDLVIDEKGKVYVIEANHKSGYLHMYIKKNPHVDKLFGLPPAFDIVYQMDMEHESTLIEYARYLATENVSRDSNSNTKL